LISSLLLFFSLTTFTSLFYTLSLHDALPICFPAQWLIWDASYDRAFSGAASHPGNQKCLRITIMRSIACKAAIMVATTHFTVALDRKSTRLNSSHRTISYAVFCLKKKT